MGHVENRATGWIRGQVHTGQASFDAAVEGVTGGMAQRPPPGVALPMDKDNAMVGHGFRHCAGGSALKDIPGKKGDPT
jgi:hypothetical protein